jgi:signal transduction histidine kinase
MDNLLSRRRILVVEDEVMVLMVIEDMLADIGISPAALASIFDLFAQDERALTICRGSLGIGLAVVRDLVERHGGTITAHSSGENLGSEFIVTLPVRGPVERRREDRSNRSP